MSNIPFSAIGAAFSPVQRATNDLLRARRVQSEKDSHHTEDVEELDDTAVNSINDRQQGRGRQKNADSRGEGEPEEKVEIAALEAPLQKSAPKPTRPARQLDISA